MRSWKCFGWDIWSYIVGLVVGFLFPSDGVHIIYSFIFPLFILINSSPGPVVFVSCILNQWIYILQAEDEWSNNFLRSNLTRISMSISLHLFFFYSKNVLPGFCFNVLHYFHECYVFLLNSPARRSWTGEKEDNNQYCFEVIEEVMFPIHLGSYFLWWE